MGICAFEGKIGSSDLSHERRVVSRGYLDGFVENDVWMSGWLNGLDGV